MMAAGRPRPPSRAWIVSALAVAVLGASFLWSPSEFPKLELCWLRRWTDLSCPGCGLTRSFCAVSHGDFAAAWSFHPFGVVLYALTVACAVWPFVAWRWPDLGSRWGSSRVVFWLGGSCLVAFLAHGVARAVQELAARAS